jgi:GNAT superfamily N-acetyltransferase
VLLVAWVDGRPVGDVFLSLGPADEPEVRRHLPGVPTLVHLEVVGPLQRRGIGTALVRAGEDVARRLGHDRVALGVGLDNPGARRLYERLGYTDWGRGHTVASWREHRPGGAPVTVTETIDMLVKRL